MADDEEPKTPARYSEHTLGMMIAYLKLVRQLVDRGVIDGSSLAIDLKNGADVTKLQTSASELLSILGDGVAQSIEP